MSFASGGDTLSSGTPGATSRTAVLMNLVSISTARPTRQVDVPALERELEASIEGEIRFDKVSRALYSTDASVYRSSRSASSFLSRART